MSNFTYKWEDTIFPVKAPANTIHTHTQNMKALFRERLEAEGSHSFSGEEATGRHIPSRVGVVKSSVILEQPSATMKNALHHTKDNNLWTVDSKATKVSLGVVDHGNLVNNQDDDAHTDGVLLSGERPLSSTLLLKGSANVVFTAHTGGKDEPLLPSHVSLPFAQAHSSGYFDLEDISNNTLDFSLLKVDKSSSTTAGNEYITSYTSKSHYCFNIYPKTASIVRPIYTTTWVYGVKYNNYVKETTFEVSSIHIKSGVVGEIV